MSEYELVLQGLCVICQKTFGVSIDQIEKSINLPVFIIIGSPNALDVLYFLLEITRKYRISLSNDLIENNVKWSLSELATEVLNCKQHS